MHESHPTIAGSMFGIPSKTPTSALLDSLSTRQHLRPHEPLESSIRLLTESLGVCPGAAEQALRWLGLDSATPIGRLRRTELNQLATAIHRYWRQNASQTAPAPDAG